VQTHQLHVSNGRERVVEIRRELFQRPEVLDVFVTGRSDVLVVVCLGRPRPAEWLRTLRVAGYEAAPRRHARIESGESNPDRNAWWAKSRMESTEPPAQVRRRSSRRLYPWTSTTSIRSCG